MPHICRDIVDKNCLPCDKCKHWIHYHFSKLPAYLIIQFSKSTRVFTCHPCVKSKYPLAFQKLHDDIEKIIMSPINQSISPIKPTTPLTPSAPSSPLFIQLTPTPLIPSAPSNLFPVIASPRHISPTPDDSSTISKLPTSNPQQLSPNPVQKKPCTFYLQDHCMHDKKGSDCAYPHPPMCFNYIKRGPKGCAKGTSCNFVHPKLCRASLVSGKCDRNRCYFYHVTGSARSNHMNATSNPQNKMHGSNYHPTPLMQVSVPPPHVPKPVSNAPQSNTASPPAQTPISDPQPAHTTSFLEELKEIRSQMLQMQQTQNLLMQNMLNQMWPPLPSQKPRHLPNQMF